MRKVKEGEPANDLFAFLTTEPNAIVAPARHFDIARRDRRLDDSARAEGLDAAAPVGR